jgi:hypothetical protein
MRPAWYVTTATNPVQEAILDDAAKSPSDSIPRSVGDSKTKVQERQGTTLTIYVLAGLEALAAARSR